MRERLSWWLPMLTHHWTDASVSRHTYVASWGPHSTQETSASRLYAAWLTWWHLVRFRFSRKAL